MVQAAHARRGVCDEFSSPSVPRLPTTLALSHLLSHPLSLTLSLSSSYSLSHLLFLSLSHLLFLPLSHPLFLSLILSYSLCFSFTLSLFLARSSLWLYLSLFLFLVFVCFFTFFPLSSSVLLCLNSSLPMVLLSGEHPVICSVTGEASSTAVKAPNIKQPCERASLQSERVSGWCAFVGRVGAQNSYLH